MCVFSVIDMANNVMDGTNVSVSCNEYMSMANFIRLIKDVW